MLKSNRKKMLIRQFYLIFKAFFNIIINIIYFLYAMTEIDELSS